MINTLVGDFSREEFMLSGHNACSGCGPAIAMRFIMKVAASGAVVVIPASCWSIISGVVPLRSLKTVVLHCPFPAAAATGGGIKKGLEAVGDSRTQVIVLAGDGGTFDIGLQGISGAAERNEDIIFICYDNEAYMNTGTQKSSATPYGSYSATTPAPKVKSDPKKDIMEIVAAHRVPYAATATIAFPGDLSQKIQRALETKGFRFIHILTPCPEGWGSPADITVKLSRLAVLTRLFPLYEIKNGAEYKLNFLPEDYLPVNEYLKPQKRFASLDKLQIEHIQESVENHWKELCCKTGTRK
ncbi:MAG: pyruvate synthase subunit beta [Firmicutes bacterium]|nr:pyruvate synthase subunit beta [Bacillota bacterium]